MSPNDPWELLEAARQARIEEMGHELNAALDGNARMAEALAGVVNEQTRMKEQIKNLQKGQDETNEDVSEMRTGQRGVTIAIIGFALSVTASAIGFATITILTR